jgi:flagellar FliL protein
MAKKKDKAAAAGPQAGEDEVVAAAEGGEVQAAPKKKLAGKTIVLFIVLPALLVILGGVGAGVMLFGSKSEQVAEAGAQGEAGKKAARGSDHKKKKKDDNADKGKEGEQGNGSVNVTEAPDGSYFAELPPLIVNIQSQESRPVYLKLKVTLEAPDVETADMIEPAMPRVMDQFQGFLRELRMEDISGSEGPHRLRMELLRRVNIALAPAEVSAVLIEEMLVQ